MNDSIRPVPTGIDADGVHIAEILSSPESNHVRAEVVAPAPNVVPIILLPGIMGSNLRARVQVELDGRTLAEAGDPVWRVDSATGVGLTWLGRSASERQRLLNKNVLEVDPNGKIEPEEHDVSWYNPKGWFRSNETIDRIEAFRQAKRRCGWGTVSWQYYGPLLGWLERSLHGLGKENGEQPNEPLANLLSTLVDTTPEGAQQASDPISPKMVEGLLDYDFPIHAFGYNWAESNLESGKKLAAYIDQIVGQYNNPDGEPASVCEKVILITHSMGGLVARAAAKAYGAEGKILGVLHGVMPTHGAGAFYKRMVAGFSNEHAHFADIIGKITARALGKTARETLPVLAFNPGPLELAPNHRYNEGRPWLFVQDARGNVIKSLPEPGAGGADPYSQIYARTDIWWRAVNPAWLDPVGNLPDPEGEYFDVLDQAEKYHRDLADAAGFHSRTYAHYSADGEHAAWGDVTWQVSASSRNLWGFGWRQNDDDAPLNGSPETWVVHDHDGDDQPLLRDSRGGEIQAEILAKSSAGDGTVPADASAAGVARYCEIVCRHPEGYDHNSDYLDERVRRWVLDVVVRMINA